MNKKKNTQKQLLWVFLPISAVLLAILLNLFVMIFAIVPSGSMEPTLQTNTLLIGSRLAYRNDPIQRGDLIFFRHKEIGRSLLIKRVIAVAGDRFEMRKGIVYINGEASVEPYVEDLGDDDYPLTVVPDGKLIVLGDHRTESKDSRYFTDPFVSVDSVIGKAIFTIFPSIKGL